MRILHTSDWHLGQTFHDFDRTNEHRLFLDWLLTTLRNEEIDALLISGDIFDVSNPSAASIRLFYSFLINAVKQCPDLQIIVTAGNHDSASRLETPQPLVELMNIHIIGSVKRDQNGSIDFSKIVLPLHNKNKEVKAWCIAAPFLRLGDYPQFPDSENPYAEGVAAFYREAFNFASAIREPNQAIVAMGHLHTLRADFGDLYDLERQILGGIEGILPSAFDDEICYVALGHIHRAQHIDKEHIRYSGSPLPMSFTEIAYQHQVVVFDINGTQAENIRSLEIPISVPLKCVEGTLPEVLEKLKNFPNTEKITDMAPFLEVRVLLDGPEPSLRFQIDERLKGKNVRLIKITPIIRNAQDDLDKTQILTIDNLNRLEPIDLLESVYKAKYNNNLPENLNNLFQLAVEEVYQQED